MARPITYKIIDDFYRAREAVSEGNGNRKILCEKYTVDRRIIGLGVAAMF